MTATRINACARHDSPAVIRVHLRRSEGTLAVQLTTGSPWRVIALFSLPLLIGNVVQQLYHVVDAIVVGRHLGVNALASVGATGAITFLIIGFAWGLTSGFAIPLATAYGADDEAAVRRSVATGTVLTAIGSLILTIGGPLISRPLLRLLQTPPELIDDAAIFIQIILAGSAGMMFFNYLASIVRGIGDSSTPLYFLTLSCVVNIVLVIAFVAWFGWGIAGAAWATFIAQFVSVFTCVWYIFKKIPALHPRREDFRLDRADVKEHLRLGLPMALQASIISIGTLVVQVALNRLGADAIAAYTAAGRIDSLATTFLASIGLAMSVFVAQNVGARRPDRIRRGVKQGVWLAVGVGAALGVLMIAFGTFFTRMFVGDGEPQVIELAHQMFVVNGIAYWVLGVLFVLRGALQGLGQALIPTICGIAELIMRVAAAVVLGPIIGFVGVAISNPAAWVGAVFILIPAYLAARKKLDAMPVDPKQVTDTTAIAIQGPQDGSLTVDELVVTASIHLPKLDGQQD